MEHEAKLDSDRPLVAGVYVNRLDLKKWPTGLLESNPTVNYANDSVWLNAHPIGTWVGYTFWLDVGGTTPLAKIVFPDNIAPYNTYHNSGLPPTPISWGRWSRNVGRASPEFMKRTAAVASPAT